MTSSPEGSTSVRTPAERARGRSLGAILEEHRALAALGIAGSSILLGCLDWVTPYEIHFQVFYAFPVAVCVWVLGVAWASALSFLSIIFSMAVYVHEGGHYTSSVGLEWDFFIRVVSFALFIAVVKRFRETFDAERKAHAASQDVSRLKGDLLGLISHELGNASFVIQSCVADIRESYPERSAELDEPLSAVERVATSLSEASHNFLSRAAIEAGQVAMRLEAVPIARLFLELESRFKPRAKNKRLDLQFMLGSAEMAVRADPAALRLVLVNLIGNAIKYTPDGRSIHVCADLQEPRKVCLAVRDTGIGIAPEDLEKIRETFYRAEGGRQMAKGYGMGLSIVDGLLKAHGCSVSIESEPGRGSEFSFVLPAASSAAQSQIEHEEQQAAYAGFATGNARPSPSESLERRAMPDRRVGVSAKPPFRG